MRLATMVRVVVVGVGVGVGVGGLVGCMVLWELDGSENHR